MESISSLFNCSTIANRPFLRSFVTLFAAITALISGLSIAHAAEKRMSVRAPTPPLPVYKGPYCESETSTLKNTLAPTESLNERFLCALNGRDLIERFAKDQNFDRDKILDDYKHRISPVFAIPDNIRERVGFWFDIYTKYPSYMRIIHHAKYPWIKFREFDLTDFLVSPHIEWMKLQKSEKFIHFHMSKVKSQLLKLSKRKKFDNLNEDEQYLVDALADIQGSRSKVYAEAAQNLRIQTGQMDFFVEAIMRKSQYIEEMEKIFEDMGVPTELTRLPLVESSFNPEAISKAGASGIWQFMPVTGRSIMKVTEDIDERNSPMKSTIGAAKYLRSNARGLHNLWPLSVLAYNHGPGGVSRALKARKTKDITVLINSHSGGSFGFASANYYPEFLAALYAEKYQRDVFGRLTTLPKIEFETVRLPQPIKPFDIGRALELPVDIILRYNLDTKTAMKKNSALPVGYVLHVPKGFGHVLTAFFEERAKDQPIVAKRKVRKAQLKSSTVTAVAATSETDGK